MGFKIYTRTGDDGTTGLVGGSRILKSEMRLDAYGTIDELNAWIGLIRSITGDQNITGFLIKIQNTLFVIGSKLASDDKGKPVTDKLHVSDDDISGLEMAMDTYDQELKSLHNFILPGGSPLVSYCHIARTVCRRAERLIVKLAQNTAVDKMIIQYINRLSDYLFVLSRKMALDENVDELNWTH